MNLCITSQLIHRVSMTDVYSLVADIIERFGPRKAGSESETKAQLYLAELMSGFCDRVNVEPFRSPLGAKFLSLRVFCVLFWVALLMPSFSLYGAFFLSGINAFIFIGHFVMYRNWLDFAYPSVESRNVVGTIEPTGEMKRTIIISGHMDSTPEFIWWYWLKDWGIRLMVLSGLSFVLLPLYFGVSLALDIMAWKSHIWWVFVGTSPLALLFFFIHGKKVVDGAQDNLSGVAVACAVAKQFSAERLHNIRLQVVSFGAEETGLRGSAAFNLIHKGFLKATPHHVINLDGILDKENMHLVTSEPSIPARHDKELNDRLAKVFEAHGMPVRSASIPVGATDASSFSRNGVSATSIVGLPMNRLHPTYHTRLDTIECLDPATLERTADILAAAIREWDREL